MALTKRGRFWHYDFIYKKKRYQGSTDQTNINKAKLVEAKARSDAALERFGIAPPKIAPMFKEFMEGVFLTYARRHSKARRTAIMYDWKTRQLLRFQPWIGLRLPDIDEPLIEKYINFRSGKVKVATINRELATLRRALYLAYEWKLIQHRPRILMLPGEHQRSFVISGDLENAYLEACDYPLKQAAILMLDLGLRPEECVQLRKGDIADGAARVRDGKTVNAARSLPLTKRASCQVELLCALWPKSEWLFPGHKKGTHLTRGALDNMHIRLRRRMDWPKEFILYSLRHTFGTRLAESGASPFDIKEAMGHGDVRVSQRYVHPSADHLSVALKRKEALDKTLRGEIQDETSDAAARSDQTK